MNRSWRSIIGFRPSALNWLVLALLAVFVGCEPEGTGGDGSEDAGGANLGDVPGILAGGGVTLDPDVEMMSGGAGGTGGGLIPEEEDQLQPLSLNSLTPNRSALEGGVRVRVIGSGFPEDTEVIIAGNPCGEIEWINQNRLTCVVPPAVLAGTVAVTVYRTIDGVMEESSLADGFTYFEPLQGTSIQPTRVPSRGGTKVYLRGLGLTEGTDVSVDGIPAREIELESDGVLTFVTPPHPSGPVTVTATNFNGNIELPDALTYYEVLEIEGISPSAGPLDGGTSVVIRGAGLSMDSAVSIGDESATEIASQSNQRNLTAVTPSSTRPGVVDVSVANSNGDAVLENGFIYYDDSDTSFQLFGVTPANGPVQGGTEVVVVGSGFTDTDQVFFGEGQARCNLESDHVLRCITPPGDEGLTALAIQQGDVRAEQANAFRYVRTLELISIVPDTGSVAGGTRVTIIGSGFDESTQLKLGEQLVEDVLFVDGNTLLATTPPNTPGPVDVLVERDFARDRQSDGYTYFDPVLDFGGVWGEPIDGAVNITVIHGSSGERITEAAVIVVGANGVTYETITDESGQATISADGLTGPLSITVAKEGFEASTIEDVTTSNVTIVLFPNDGDGSPPPGVTGAVLRGMVTGLGNLPKPIDETFINVIFVETSHPTPLSRPDMPEPGTGGILFEDGPFEIIAMPGEMAIIATAVEVERDDFEAYQAGLLPYYQMRKSQNPIAMGIRRFISASPGDMLDGLDVVLDHPLDQAVPVDLDNPPRSNNGGPVVYVVSPVLLNLGSDGYWELDTAGESLQPYMTLNNMPSLDGWDADIVFEVFGIAASPTPTAQPLSVSIAEVRNISNGIFITPFVGTPYLISPVTGGALGPGRRVSWGVDPGFESGVPIHPATANLVLISEPSLGGRRPIWRYLTPAGVTEFEFPVLPDTAGESGLGAGTMYLQIMPFIVDDPNFIFDEFTLMDISQLRWLSWAQTDFEFTLGQ